MLLFTDLFAKFTPEVVRTLLGYARPQETVVFNLEDLPAASPLTSEEVEERRRNGPYAEMQE